MAAPSVPSPEALQSLVLNTLASSSAGTIPDTRELANNGVKLQSLDAQNAVKSVLASLESKEVDHTMK